MSFVQSHTKKREKTQAERPLSNILFRNYIQQRRESESKKSTQQIERPTNDCCLSDDARVVLFGFSGIFFSSASASLCFNNIIYNSTNDGGPQTHSLTITNMQSLLKLQWPNNRIIIHTTRDHTHTHTHTPLLSFVGALGPILFLFPVCLWVSARVYLDVMKVVKTRTSTHSKRNIPPILSSCARSDSLNKYAWSNPVPFAYVLIGMITTFFSSNYTIFNAGMVHFLSMSWMKICAKSTLAQG